MDYKISKLLKILLISCFIMVNFFGAVVAQEKSGKKILDKAEKYYKSRKLKDLRKALAIYEGYLEETPRNFDALLKASKTAIFILDIKTNALVREKDKNKKILENMSEKAYNYAERAREISPDSKKAIAYFLQAYGYYIPTYNIIKTAFSEAPDKINRLVNKLNRIDPYFDGCTGYQTLGRMYWESPWPVGDVQKSRKNYKKALELNPDLLQPRYWLAKIKLEQGKEEAARSYLEELIERKPTSLEAHFIGAFKSKARSILKNLDKN